MNETPTFPESAISSMLRLSSSWAHLREETRQRLEPFLPIGIVLRLVNIEGVPTIQGRTELSWSMDWDASRTNLWWSGKAYSLLGEHVLDGMKDARSNTDSGSFMFNVFAPSCPIEIDWESWLSAKDKFNRRNAKFTVKPLGVYVLRARTAEEKVLKLEQINADLSKFSERFHAIADIVNPSENEE